MHPTVLNRMLSALSKHGAAGLDVCVHQCAHASLEGGNEKFYRLVHFNHKASLVWLVNPVTDYVCKVGVADIAGWRYAKGQGQQPNANGEPPPPLYVVFTNPERALTSKEQALEVATSQAKAQRGREFYVAQSIVSVVVPSEPKPEITQY